MLADRLQDAVVNLGPMRRNELRRTLEEPAAKVGLEFEPGLVDRILDEVGDEPGNLPLLEYVLAELWQERRGRTLHFEAYEAMQGIKGAIANRAERIFQRELTTEQQEAARRVLMQMVRPGEGTPDTRKRTLLPAEDDPALAVVRRLADARLLVTSRDEEQTNAQTVEIAHEALIQNWGLLQQWVNEDREFLRTRERIEGAAMLWEQEGQTEERLLAPGRPLAEAEEVLNERRTDLSPALVRFIEASLAADQRRQDNQRAAHLRELKRARRRLAGALLALLVIAVLGAYAFYQKINADDASRKAETRREEADRERNIALSRWLAAQASLLVERGQGEDALLKAAALAIESWRRLPNADMHAAAMKLLEWLPVMRIQADPGSGAYRAQLAFSPDGRFLVIGIFPAIRLIETATGRELWRTELRDEPVGSYRFRFSADSRLLLINTDKNMRLVGTESAREISSMRADELSRHVFLEQKGWFNEFFTMSRDGRWLVLTAEDGATRKYLITLLDARTGKETCRIEHLMNRQQGALAVFFSKNERILGIRDGSAFHLFDLPDGRERTTFSVDHARDAFFIADDRWLGVEAHYPDKSITLHLFDSENGRGLNVIPAGKGGSFEFSPDGRHLVTRNDSEKLLRLLDMPSGKERARWEGGYAGAYFDKSGRWLIVKTAVGTFRLIDTASGREVSRIEAGCEAGYVNFVGETDSFMVACQDGQIRTYQASTGEEKTRFQAGPRPIISPDKRLIISIDEGLRVLRLIEAAAGREFGRIATSGRIQIGPLSLGLPGDSCLSPDGRYFALPGSQGSIMLADLSRRHSPLLLEADIKRRVAISRDRRLLAFTSPDHVVQVVDTATGRSVGALRHEAPAYPVHISADGRLLTTEQESFLKINEIESGREVDHLEQTDKFSARVSPAGNFLLIRGYDHDRLVSSGTLKEILRCPSERSCCLPVFSPDERLFALTDRFERVVQVFDTQTGAERLRVAPKRPYRSMMGPCCPEFSPDGLSLAVNTLEGVELLDVSTGEWRKQRYQWPEAPGINTTTFSPDGRTLAIEALVNADEEIWVALFDVSTERKLAHVVSRSGDRGGRQSKGWSKFAFSPDSRYFAVGAAGGDPARLFDTRDGKELASIGLGWGLAGVSFSPDSRFLAATSSNGAVRLFDVESRRLLGKTQHAMAVTHLEFSANSRFLVTSSMDGTARMIDTRTGGDIARFEHGEPVDEAHFSPDGKSLMLVGRQKVKIWPADPEWPFEQLCARSGRNLSREEWRSAIGDSEPWQATCQNWHHSEAAAPLLTPDK
jgi:WD40 repeat protein